MSLFFAMSSEVQSDDDEQTVCVICCDEITEEQKQNGGQITLSCCTHVFHGQCFVNLLCHNILNPFCPICRADPTDPIAAANNIDFDTQVEEYQYMSPREAINFAKKDQKNATTQRSLQGISKWKRTEKDLKACLKTINDLITFEEKLIDTKAKAYNDKLRAEFQLKYAKEISARKTYLRGIRKAKGNARNIQRRLAIKYGWRP